MDRFWMNDWGSDKAIPDNKVYSFTLLDGRTLSGQVVNEEVTYMMDGQIYVLPIREGAATTITYIPWKNIMSYKRL